jgi:hypothetical protein
MHIADRWTYHFDLGLTHVSHKFLPDREPPLKEQVIACNVVANQG